jgi:type I restriction enzyme M protein
VLMSSTIKTNERELSNQVACWFNDHIKRNDFPFTSASSEVGIKTDGKTYFGDIVIWNDREAKNANSYLELKPPFGNREDLDRFKKKAAELGVKIAYTWDFQTLSVYKIESNKLTLLDSESNSILTKIDDWLRGDVQAKIKSFIYKICDELLTVSTTKRFTKFKPEKHYFIQFIRDTVSALIPVFENFIKEQYRKRENKDIINKYVIEQGITYPSDDAFFKLIASQRVYGLVTKIIFYLTIRRYFSDLPALLQEAEPDLNQNLNHAFSKAAEKDWQAVFIGGPIADLGIPQTAFAPLQELFANLEIYHFGELPEDVIGELFEEIIDPEQRHLLGQYFTREDLVDFVIATIVNDPTKYYADPTCGSGTFLIRLYSRLKFLDPKLKHEQILEKIWGIDIGKFPAELATINLFRQDVSNFENFPRILNKDIFEVNKGDSFGFPPPFAGKNYVKISIPLPEFGGLVGNFPFIRQELIEKKVPGVKLKLTKLLASEFLHTYPELFELDKKITPESLEQLKKENGTTIEERISKLVDKKQISLTLSGQADIYSYIFLHTTTLLSQDGALAVITSNSWLDVSYGSVIKQFLLSHYKIKMIVASWAEPWFEDAAVNTVFTVLEKEPDAEKRQSNAVKFVKLKRKLKELVPEPVLQPYNTARWQKFEGLIRKIDLAEYKNRPVATGIQSFEDADLRVRLVQQSQLASELTQNDKLSKWGKYLRAPDVF